MRTGCRHPPLPKRDKIRLPLRNRVYPLRIPTNPRINIRRMPRPTLPTPVTRHPNQRHLGFSTACNERTARVAEVRTRVARVVVRAYMHHVRLPLRQQVECPSAEYFRASGGGDHVEVGVPQRPARAGGRVAPIA